MDGDVVKVVRCRDCTQFQDGAAMMTPGAGYCWLYDTDMYAADYCSNGERREGGVGELSEPR